MQSSNEYTDIDDNFNLREELKPYLNKWPWFVLSVLIAISIAFIYLRYTPQSYQTTASILIKDEGSSDLSQIAMFQDLGMGKIGSVNLDNEIKILKSRPLTERTVEQLNLYIRYFSEGRVRTTELFESSPIRLEVLTPEIEWPMQLPSLLITPLSLTEFSITQEGASTETHEFGEEFVFEDMKYRLHPNQLENTSLNNSIRVNIHSINRTVDSYKNRFDISPDSRQGSIINISLTSSTPDRDRAVIDELIHQFNRDAIEDKNLVSRNTADFIDDRLSIIWEELDSVETGKVSYKEEHRLVDLQQQGSIFLETAKEYNERLLQIQTELSQINAMIRYLKSDSDSSLLPANLGVADSGLIALIQQYNQLVLERNQLLANTTETHPTVVRLTKQLGEMKSNVLQSLENAKESLDIKLADLNKQERLIGSQLAGIPLQEKDFTNIERQQEIKQSLYLYLLQKREETSIALAVTEPKAKVVETAYTPLQPVAPKRSIILLASVLLGGLVPFGVIYLHGLLDNKVRKRSDITDAIPGASILGEIPKARGEYVVIKRNDLDMTAEAYRVLRNNMRFADLLHTNGNENGKIILITSSIPGEGKTTISTNLALTLSYTGRKVLLVGADIRNPKIHHFYDDKRKFKGLVNYIVDESSHISDFIVPSIESEHLDVLHSGDVPPNPEEILTKKRFSTFLEEAKEKYDFVILDTAPTLLVTDTLLISDKADATLYVVNAGGKTEKEVLGFVKELKDDKKLNNVHFVLNSVDYANYGYGGKYGYGYGYGQEEIEGPWKRFTNVFRRS